MYSHVILHLFRAHLKQMSKARTDVGSWLPVDPSEDHGEGEEEGEEGVEEGGKEGEGEGEREEGM